MHVNDTCKPKSLRWSHIYFLLPFSANWKPSVLMFRQFLPLFLSQCISTARIFFIFGINIQFYLKEMKNEILQCSFGGWEKCFDISCSGLFLKKIYLSRAKNPALYQRPWESIIKLCPSILEQKQITKYPWRLKSLF